MSYPHEPRLLERPHANPPSVDAKQLSINERQRSQISGGHRLIRLVRQKRSQLYSRDEFIGRAVRISADYWLDSFVPALRVRMNEAIALRINAVITRTRAQSGAYGIAKPGVAEYVAEAFFDNWWFKVQESHVSRLEIRDHVRAQLAKGNPLELIFPILSRKPLSPVKNRGVHPDLGEVHSLVRCAEAAQVINALCPTGCRLTILADGFKYNRACRTPDDVVADYQRGLSFWLDRLDVADIVQLVNYENWVAEGLDTGLVSARQRLYVNYCVLLEERYGPLVDASNLVGSLPVIADKDVVGLQLVYTFWSIVTSTFYPDLLGTTVRQPSFDGYGDEVQKLYVAYVLSLHRVLTRGSGEWGRPPPPGYVDPMRYADLFHSMREEAWGAAVRYVAISLTDRDLQVLKQIKPKAVKLTIHGKKGELHFLSATQRDAAMTAQHSTGGLAVDGDTAKITFRYRLEREGDGEQPILLEALPDTPYHKRHYGPLWNMQKCGQPIGYVPQRAAASLKNVHQIIARKA